MTSKEALDILEKVSGEMSTNRIGHLKIMEAIELLRKEITSLEEIKKNIKPLNTEEKENGKNT